MMLNESQIYTFPCRADKAPLSRRGFKDAIKGVWWPRSPLVGVPTGKRNDFDVLDVDGRAGREWLARNAIPPTRVHYTQRGAHLLFAHATGLRCSTGRIADGVDVRAEGGYIVWWPREGLPIEDLEIAVWPDWLLAKAMGPGRGRAQKEHLKFRPSPFMVVMWVVVRPLARSAIGSTEYCGRSSGRRRASATMCCSGRGAATRR